MSNTSRVLSNREYDKFMKEKKLQAFKKCDPIVQGTLLYFDRQISSLARKAVSCPWHGRAARKTGKCMSACVNSTLTVLRASLNDDAMMEAEKDYLEKSRSK